MSHSYARVTKFVCQYPWAILPENLDALLEVLALRIEGTALTDEEIQARISGMPPSAGVRSVPRSPGDPAPVVGVLPVYGILAHRMDMMTKVSGGSSLDGLAQAFDAMVANPQIGSILLDVDSPGGSVFGVQEFADRIYQARGTKPIVAVANATAASAAYWLASQADTFAVTPSGQVGSIGVIAVHQDRSKQADMLGVKHTFITAGKHKGDGSDLAPLDDATKEDMQRRVDQYYGAFVEAVARGRGASTKAVRAGFGEGRVVSASDAMRLGMVDGVSTYDAVVGRLVQGRPAIGALTEPEEEEVAAKVDPFALTVAGLADQTFRRRLAEYEDA